jgi:hypothetical protein
MARSASGREASLTSHQATLMLKLRDDAVFTLPGQPWRVVRVCLAARWWKWGPLKAQSLRGRGTHFQCRVRFGIPASRPFCSASSHHWSARPRISGEQPALVRRAPHEAQRPAGWQRAEVRKRIESSWEHSHSRSDAPANRRCDSMKPGHSPALAPAADGQPDP